MSNAAPAARDARPKPGGTSMGPILLGVAAVALLAGAVTAWPRTVDDSFITYRYAENLAHGQGAIFNPGERVEGYSSPSWMLLLAAAIAAGLDPETVSKALGLISSLLLLWLVYRALRRAGVSGAGAGLAAISLGASYVFQLWSVAGLETNAYALLFFAGLALLAEPGLTPRTSLPASATLAAAALTRPEGIAFWGLGLALVALTKHPARMRSVGLYLLPGLAIGAHLLWRTSYYGNLLPNTYYAKTGGGAALWTQGWTELRDFALTGRGSWRRRRVPWSPRAFRSSAGASWCGAAPRSSTRSTW